MWLSLPFLSMAFSALGHSQHTLIPLSADGRSSVLEFSRQWDCLGPFQIGTRESAWGADPLEALGGFAQLEHDPKASFKSSLSPNASIKWSSVTAELDSSDHRFIVRLEAQHDEIDWTHAQQVYGWAGLQYQTWARGYLYNRNPNKQRIVLYTDGILELSINDEHIFGGDFYGFRRAPIVAHINPGLSRIDIRLIRDVRTMGSGLPPKIAVSIEAEMQESHVSFSESGIIFPDVVEGTLVSSYGSIIVRNNGEDWMTIKKCTISADGSSSRSGQNRERLPQQLRSNVLYGAPVRLAPGQPRPIVLNLTHFAVNVQQSFVLTCFTESTSGAGTEPVSLQVNLKTRKIDEPHKMTFLHPSGAVSYAILRAPKHRVDWQEFPILLNLHGAGVDADSHQVRHQLDAVSDLDAWVLFPTGMGPWSGDDWHVWGTSDVKAAIAAIPLWIKTMKWRSPGVLLEQWIVSGHSNGGQGTWYLASRYPDCVMAAAPVSGYSSIENYVPYTMWSHAEPLKSAILGIARISFRHELFVENLVNIPILQQHGSSDDNVPPYHSRLMNQLLHLAGSDARYVELPGEGHWYDGVMTTGPLREFYQRRWRSKNPLGEPPLFSASTQVFPNTGDKGSWYGIEVEQLESPDSLGRIALQIDWGDDGPSLELRTSNIFRMRLKSAFLGQLQCQNLILDETDIPFGSLSYEESFSRSSDGSWRPENDEDWKKLRNRYGKQRGALDSLMQTSGPFQIIPFSSKLTPKAVQISRNMLQYFGADSEIIDPSNYSTARDSGGNLMSIFIGRSEVPAAVLEGFPIRIDEYGVHLYQISAEKTTTVRISAGMGAIFLRPLHDERLELVVWGLDPLGLYRAMRLIPTLTGAGQPDFIVLNNKAGWLGHAGAAALGFFDHDWNISAASFVASA